MCYIGNQRDKSLKVWLETYRLKEDDFVMYETAMCSLRSFSRLLIPIEYTYLKQYKACIMCMCFGCFFIPCSLYRVQLTFVDPACTAKNHKTKNNPIGVRVSDSNPYDSCVIGGV